MDGNHDIMYKTGIKAQWECEFGFHKNFFILIPILKNNPNNR